MFCLQGLSAFDHLYMNYDIIPIFEDMRYERSHVISYFPNSFTYRGLTSSLGVGDLRICRFAGKWACLSPRHAQAISLLGGVA